jgi:transposase-like protein
MVQVKDLTQLTIAELWKEVKSEDFWEEVSQETLRMVKRLVEGVLEEEMVAHLQATWYKRGPERVGYRNGYYGRSLVTRWGLIDELRIPRDRGGSFHSQVLERYQRFQGQVEEQVREMFLRGVSTRQVEKVLEPLLDTGISAQTVSRITRSLYQFFLVRTYTKGKR